MSQRFSAIKFYPLVENKEKVNFTDAFTTEERNKPEGLTIQDYIDKLKASTPAAETADI